MYGRSYKLSSVTKPMYFGPRLEEEMREDPYNPGTYIPTGNKIEVNTYVKISGIELSDDFLNALPYDTILRQLRDRMEETGVGEIYFGSGVKMGKPSTKFTIQDFIDGKNPGFNKITLFNKHYRLQLNPRAKTDSETALFSQLMYFLNILGMNNEKAHKAYSAVSFLFETGLNEFNEKTSTKSGFTNFIKRALGDEADERIRQLIEAGVFPDNPILERRSLIKLASSLEKLTTKVKLPGGKFVLQSDVGTRKEGEELKYFVDEQGRLMAEMIIPRGILAPEVEAQIENEVDVFGGAELLGWRIPSTELHSAVAIKVVGFYDSKKTNVVIAPALLVALHGSDFDVDSLFVVKRPQYKEDVLTPTLASLENVATVLKELRRTLELTSNKAYTDAELKALEKLHRILGRTVLSGASKSTLKLKNLLKLNTQEFQDGVEAMYADFLASSEKEHSPETAKVFGKIAGVTFSPLKNEWQITSELMYDIQSALHAIRNNSELENLPEEIKALVHRYIKLQSDIFTGKNAEIMGLKGQYIGYRFNEENKKLERYNDFDKIAVQHLERIKVLTETIDGLDLAPAKTMLKQVKKKIMNTRKEYAKLIIFETMMEAVTEASNRSRMGKPIFKGHWAAKDESGDNYTPAAALHVLEKLELIADTNPSLTRYEDSYTALKSVSDGAILTGIIANAIKSLAYMIRAGRTPAMTTIQEDIKKLERKHKRLTKNKNDLIGTDMDAAIPTEELIKIQEELNVVNAEIEAKQRAYKEEISKPNIDGTAPQITRGHLIFEGQNLDQFFETITFTDPDQIEKQVESVVWDLLDSFVNVAIDNVKDMELPKINANTDNIKTIIALLARGMDAKSVLLLINNPLILEAERRAMKPKGTLDKSFRELRAEIKQKYKKLTQEDIKSTTPELDRKTLENMAISPEKRFGAFVDSLFKQNPNFAELGMAELGLTEQETKEHYLAYLDSKFPDSEVRGIVYRGINASKQITTKRSKELGTFFTDNEGVANTYALANEQLDNDPIIQSIVLSIAEKFGLEPTRAQIESELEESSKTMQQDMWGENKNKVIDDILELFYGEKSKTFKGHVQAALVNIEAPKRISVKDWFDYYREGKDFDELKEDTDGLILKGGKQSDNRIYDRGENQIVTYLGNQVHYLGTSKDLSSFKKFLALDRYEKMSEDLLDQIRVIQFYERGTSTGTVISDMSTLLSIVRTLPVTYDKLEYLFETLNKLGTIKGNIDNIPDIESMSIEEYAEALKHTDLEFVSRTEVDIPLFLKMNPHIVSSLRILMSLRRVADANMFVHSPFFRNLIDELKLPLRFESSGQEEARADVRREAVRYLFTQAIPIDFRKEEASVQYDIDKSFNLYGQSAWTYKFIETVERISEYEQKEAANIPTYKSNSFLDSISIVPRGKRKVLRFVQTSELSPADVENIESGFRRLALFEMKEDGSIVKHGSVNDNSQFNRKTYSSVLQDYFVYFAILNYGLNFSYSSYGRVIPPHLIVNQQTRLYKVFKKIQEDPTYAKVVSQHIFIELLRENPEKITTFINTSKVGRPIPVGEEEDITIHESEQGKEVKEKRQYSGLHEDPETGMRFYYDRKFINPVKVPSNRKEDSRDFPLIFAQGFGKDYQIFMRINSPLEDQVFYQRIAVNTGTYEKLPKNVNYYNRHKAFNPEIKTIFTRDVNKRRIITQQDLSPYIESGEIIRLVAYNDMTRVSPRYVKVLQFDAETNSYVIDDSNTMISDMSAGLSAIDAIAATYIQRKDGRRQSSYGYTVQFADGTQYQVEYDYIAGTTYKSTRNQIPKGLTLDELKTWVENNNATIINLDNPDENINCQ
jgi:hypothetical protein